MKLGKLIFSPAIDHQNLLAAKTHRTLSSGRISDVFVSAIDPAFSDPAVFCKQYSVGLDASANCVVVEAKRSDKTWYVVCVILATDRIDINGIVRRQIEARKASFAPMNTAISLTDMEFGGITPI